MYKPLRPLLICARSRYGAPPLYTSHTRASRIASSSGSPCLRTSVTMVTYGRQCSCAAQSDLFLILTYCSECCSAKSGAPNHQAKPKRCKCRIRRGKQEDRINPEQPNPKAMHSTASTRCHRSEPLDHLPPLICRKCRWSHRRTRACSQWMHTRPVCQRLC